MQAYAFFPLNMSLDCIPARAYLSTLTILDAIGNHTACNGNIMCLKHIGLIVQMQAS